MTPRIRWEGDDRTGYLGYAGTVAADLFQLWVPTFSDEWTLTSTLPGQPGRAHAGGYSSDPGKLKDRAEALLAEFAASLGASFPAAPGERPAGHAEALEAAKRAVKAELEDWPEARQCSWNIAAAAVGAYLEHTGRTP